jgi:hypothetical protein
MNKKLQERNMYVQKINNKIKKVSSLINIINQIDNKMNFKQNGGDPDLYFKKAEFIPCDVEPIDLQPIEEAINRKIEKCKKCDHDLQLKDELINNLRNNQSNNQNEEILKLRQDLAKSQQQMIEHARRVELQTERIMKIKEDCDEIKNENEQLKKQLKPWYKK